MMRTICDEKVERFADAIECTLTYQGQREVKKEMKQYAGYKVGKCWIVESNKLMVEIIMNGELYSLFLPAYPRFLIIGARKKTLSVQPRSRIPYYMHERITHFSNTWRTNYGDTMRKLIDMGISIAEAAEKEKKEN